MKPKKRKSDCPWTNTQKRKKQRKTTKSISEHKKTTLAQSDKGSWFDQVKWLEEEESNASVSAWKRCSEMDSENLTEKRNNIVVTMHEYPRGGLTFAYHYSFFKIINHYLKCFLSSVNLHDCTAIESMITYPSSRISCNMRRLASVFSMGTSAVSFFFP